MKSEPHLPFDEAAREPADAAARRHAVDPAQNVVLEASAGTGKTRVLVERYVNLLLAGIDPDNILAITFTRKAAAEMRQRSIGRLKEARATSAIASARWRDLRDKLGDIAISTIDAFCLSLIREFPLEADVDPGFDLADQTEIPRLVDEALDQSLRIGRHLARSDADVAMAFVQLGERRLRTGLSALLDRRLVADDVLKRFLQFGPRDVTADVACRRAADRIRGVLATVPGGLAPFLDDGPRARASFAMLADDIARLSAQDGSSPDAGAEQAVFRELADRLSAYFTKADGDPREGDFAGTGYKADDCRSVDAWRRHRQAAAQIARPLVEALRAFRRDLNVVLSRGVWRLFQLAVSQYRRTLAAHAVLDFSEVLSRALDLLGRMEEFSRSRYRLEARYQHVLVDELQDTSRAQWDLVSLLVRSWGEGFGAASGALPPSIFVVGDRKQSIYGFRDAEVAVLDDAADFIDTLRPAGRPRQAISVSFRARPELLAFVNEVCADIARTSDAGRRDAFRYDESDRFPIDFPIDEAPRPVELVGYIAGHTLEDTSARVAAQIARLLSAGTTVRDRRTGVGRAIAPGDIAILFRSRESHREYETALERLGVPTYVYKGLGFFEADEVQDAIALLRFLADPTSDLRASAFMRSRVVRLSDRALQLLAPRLASSLIAPTVSDAARQLDTSDRDVLERVRTALPRWLALVDRITPAELLDAVLRETAYAYETRGRRRAQARENLKKLRALVRRIQNRGYATLARIADHLEQLTAGDESNAVIDALDAVNLMTVHAAKGLEFPVVFVVNLGRGTGGPRAPIRVQTDGHGTPSVAIGDFESEADEDTQAREREETKRLLYVALTRARDRLYLSGTLKDHAFRPGHGSLAEVLPKSICARIEQAGAAGMDGAGQVEGVALPEAEPVGAHEDRFVAIDAAALDHRVAVLRYVETEGAPLAGPRRNPFTESTRTAGTLAHRLFREDEPWEAAGRLEASGEARATVERAAELAAGMRREPRLAAALASGRPLYEVPFSMRIDARTIVRGAIDCLILGDAGGVTVVELKTGAPRQAHDRQLAIYLDAARELFPGRLLEGLLVYA